MERSILLAEQIDAPLVVLHVPGSKVPLDPDEELRLRSEIRDEFDLSVVNAEIVFEYGSVPDVIAKVAKQKQCALTVTGVAQFNSPRDYLLGTAVDYLVRQSSTPVLVVKRRALKPYERLLVATDFSECSVEAVRAAGAMFPEAALRLVHSFHAAYEAFLERESTIDFIQGECEQSMKLLLEGLPDEVRCRVEGLNDEGLLGTVIAEEITNWRADMLVVGSHGRSGLAHATIGDTAADLLKTASCDVLLVRGVGH